MALAVGMTIVGGAAVVVVAFRSQSGTDAIPPNASARPSASLLPAEAGPSPVTAAAASGGDAAPEESSRAPEHPPPPALVVTAGVPSAELPVVRPDDSPDAVQPPTDSALDPDVREEGPVGTELPDLPTDDAVRLAFESVRERVRRCLSGRSATLDCRAEVDGPTGRPTSTSVTGDEASSSCVRGIVDALEFPAFAQPTATVRYTYRFRTVSPTSPRPPPPSRTDAGGQRTIGTIDESYPQVGENPF